MHVCCVFQKGIFVKSVCLRKYSKKPKDGIRTTERCMMYSFDVVAFKLRVIVVYFAGFMKHRIKVVGFSSFFAAHFFCIWSTRQNCCLIQNERIHCASGKQKNALAKHTANQTAYFETQRRQHKRMSMSCLCRINISNAAMYIYELHFVELHISAEPCSRTKVARRKKPTE